MRLCGPQNLPLLKIIEVTPIPFTGRLHRDRRYGPPAVWQSMEHGGQHVGGCGSFDLDFMDNQKTVQLTANETLRGLRSGDTAVLKQIYTDHFGACYRKISAAGGTMEECREVFQEGLYVLLVKAKDPDFQLKTSFQGYLVQTCYFLWLKPQKNIRRLVPLLNEEVRSDNNVASRAEFEQKEKTTPPPLLRSENIPKRAAACWSFSFGPVFRQGNCRENGLLDQVCQKQAPTVPEHPAWDHRQKTFPWISHHLRSGLSATCETT
jgi:DNA-directed RNA polymerase specialized sigma24 family protein